jgi:hypothetical protein
MESMIDEMLLQSEHMLITLTQENDQYAWQNFLNQVTKHEGQVLTEDHTLIFDFMLHLYAYNGLEYERTSYRELIRVLLPDSSDLIYGSYFHRFTFVGSCVRQFIFDLIDAADISKLKHPVVRERTMQLFFTDELLPFSQRLNTLFQSPMPKHVSREEEVLIWRGYKEMCKCLFDFLFYHSSEKVDYRQILSTLYQNNFALSQLFIEKYNCFNHRLMTMIHSGDCSLVLKKTSLLERDLFAIFKSCYSSLSCTFLSHPSYPELIAKSAQFVWLSVESKEEAVRRRSSLLSGYLDIAVSNQDYHQMLTIRDQLLLLKNYQNRIQGEG